MTRSLGLLLRVFRIHRTKVPLRTRNDAERLDRGATKPDLPGHLRATRHVPRRLNAAESGQDGRVADVLAIKANALRASVGRGNDADDTKTAAGERREPARPARLGGLLRLPGALGARARASGRRW